VSNLPQATRVHDDILWSLAIRRRDQADLSQLRGDAIAVAEIHMFALRRGQSDTISSRMHSIVRCHAALPFDDRHPQRFVLIKGSRRRGIENE
jgi:hypothetical protein